MHNIRTVSITLIASLLLLRTEYVQCADSSSSSSSTSCSSSKIGELPDSERKIRTDNYDVTSTLALHWFEQLGYFKDLGTRSCKCKHIDCLYQVIYKTHKKNPCHLDDAFRVSTTFTEFFKNFHTTFDPLRPSCLDSDDCERYSEPKMVISREGVPIKAAQHNFTLTCNQQECRTLFEFGGHNGLVIKYIADTIDPDFFAKIGCRKSMYPKTFIATMHKIYQDVLQEEQSRNDRDCDPSDPERSYLTVAINTRIMRRTSRRLTKFARSLYQQAQSGSAGSSSSTSSHSSTSSMLHNSSSSSSSSPSCFSPVTRSKSLP